MLFRSEYQKNPGAYRTTPISGRQPAGAPTVPPPQPRMTISQGIPSGLENLARMNAERVRSSDPRELAKEPGANPFEAASAAAAEANKNTPQTLQFAEAIARIPRGQSGPLQAQFFNPLFQRIIPLMQSMGMETPQFTDTTSALDVIAKIRASMSSAGAAMRQERAFQSIQNILNSIPSDVQSKQGQAELVSSMIANDMLVKEEDAFYQNYRNYLEGFYNLNAIESRAAGSGVSNYFHSQARANIAGDKQALTWMIMNPLNVVDPQTRQERPISNSIFEYMTKNAGNYPAEFTSALSRTFGEDRARRLIYYFSGARQ